MTRLLIITASSLLLYEGLCWWFADLRRGL
jgi:hypothetical protein